MIRFTFNEPRACYTDYQITCIDDDNNVKNATIFRQNKTGYFDNLKPYSNYTISTKTFNKRDMIEKLIWNYTSNINIQCNIFN